MAQSSSLPANAQPLYTPSYSHHLTMNSGMEMPSQGFQAPNAPYGRHTQGTETYTPRASQLSSTAIMASGRQLPACVPCQSSHVGCDRGQPCSRCVRLGRPHECIPAKHRKRGWRRGRKRDKKDIDDEEEEDDEDSRGGEEDEIRRVSPTVSKKPRSTTSAKVTVRPGGPSMPVSILSFFFETQHGIVLDLKGVFLHASSKFASLLGVLPNLLTGRNMSSFIHSNDAHLFTTVLINVPIGLLQTFTVHFLSVLPDGSRRFVACEVKGKATEANEGEEKCFVASVRLLQEQGSPLAAPATDGQGLQQHQHQQHQHQHQQHQQPQQQQQQQHAHQPLSLHSQPQSMAYQPRLYQPHLSSPSSVTMQYPPQMPLYRSTSGAQLPFVLNMTPALPRHSDPLLQLPQTTLPDDVRSALTHPATNTTNTNTITASVSTATSSSSVTKQDLSGLSNFF